MKKTNFEKSALLELFRLCQNHENPQKANTLLSHIPLLFSTRNRAYCQSLFLGILRNKTLLESALTPFIKNNTSYYLRTTLLAALFESLDGHFKKNPQIVHFYINLAKPIFSAKEVQFLNAVLRKSVEHLEALLGDEQLPLSTRYSHPDFLIQRWQTAFGETATRALLEWNNTTPTIFLRQRANSFDFKGISSLQKTQWPNFYSWTRGETEGTWQEVIEAIDKGEVYAQDPSTRIPIELLKPQPGDRVLDLCAAPGGKSLQILDRRPDHLVCVDRERRLAPLNENLKGAATVIAADITSEGFLERLAPHTFNKVLLDAPCSNTGVIQRRPDVRWRLTPRDFETLPALQLKLLQVAAQCVEPCGDLVYSTCSLDSDENVGVINTFLAQNHAFSCLETRLSFPWIQAHDGAAAFLLRRG
ncbi:MAG: hypothetical protein A2Y14_02160 [Verrucomicrobia bacterium GWF2_51_19]|nr:MAG: hypothetical protein A2Y14_02160 [Verrucomicrobia bacterium GWF2_51_19]HCJ12026.1 hypothetical protein [Opitutae bacterium]